MKIRIVVMEILDGFEIVRDVFDKEMVNFCLCFCEKDLEIRFLDLNGNFNNLCVYECNCKSGSDLIELFYILLELCDDNMNNVNGVYFEKVGLKIKCKKVNIVLVE